jgi:hypothetical protein
LAGAGSGLSAQEDETTKLLSAVLSGDLKKVIVPYFKALSPVIHQERQTKTKKLDSGSPVCSVTYKNQPKKGMHVNTSIRKDRDSACAGFRQY